MKRGATKEEIISATQKLIARDGMRAVRVDEIAQSLNISKRTLYEMFADKTELVDICLNNMYRMQQQRIATFRRRRSWNPIQRTLNLLQEYVNGLFMVNCSFLADISGKILYAEHYDEHKAFWHDELVHCLENCRQQQLLLSEIDVTRYADRFINTLFELRLNRASREELYLICRTFLRGSATSKGIELIDGKHK